MAEENKQQSLWQLLLQQEKKKLLILVLALACGMVLLAYPYNSESAPAAVLPKTADLSEEAQLEQRLQRVLQQIEGVGAVEVGVSFASSGRAEYALAEQHSSNGQSASRSTDLALSGNQPVLVRQSAAELRGVVIVAQGAANPLVKERIYTAVPAMLDLNINQIAVVEGKAKEAE